MDEHLLNMFNMNIHVLVISFDHFFYILRLTVVTVSGGKNQEFMATGINQYTQTQ